uniref:Adenylate kinase n=1 Tax=Aegilops tauschii subsp. strangulata TaxID=200361 RepID=A0A453FIF3_AEGTS
MGAGGAWAKGPPAAERCARRGGRGPVEDGARVQWVFVSCPGVGKATYAGRLSRLHGVPHINTGALLRKPPLQRAATISPTHRAPPPSAPPTARRRPTPRRGAPPPPTLLPSGPPWIQKSIHPVLAAISKSNLPAAGVLAGCGERSRW